MMIDWKVFDIALFPSEFNVPVGDWAKCPVDGATALNSKDKI
jgi:hypothetical protein